MGITNLPQSQFCSKKKRSGGRHIQHSFPTVQQERHRAAVLGASRRRGDGSADHRLFSAEPVGVAGGFMPRAAGITRIRQAETACRSRPLHQRDRQDKTWTSATLEFSNGETVPVALRNTSQPQEFTFPKQECAWVRLIDFQETFPLVDNGIVELEIYGKDRRP